MRMRKEMIMAAIMFAVGAVAEESEILVTAGRGQRSSENVPANVTVISRDEINASRKESVVDVLSEVEGVVVQGIADNPAVAQVSMRGFGENGFGRVLVMVDGRRMNWPDMTNVNWLQVPLSNIERIEVVRGSGSVLYGDHAVAGVINIITRKAIPEKPFEVKATAGSDGLVAASAAYSARHGNADLTLNVDRYEEDGYRDRSAFESTGYSVGVGADIGDNAQASLSVLVQSDEYELPGWLSKEQMEADPKQSNNPDDSSERDYLDLHAKVVAEPADGQSIELDVSVSRQESLSDMTSWFSFSDRVLDSIALMPKYVIGAKPGATGNRLTVGIDIYNDELEVDRFSDKARTMPGNSANIEKDSIGGYVYDELALDGGLVLAAGLRAEENEVSAEVGSGGVVTLDESKSHNATAVEVSLLKKLGEGSKVFIKYADVYRYPFLDEQIAYSGYSEDRFYTDIDPEEGWSLEAGFDRAGETLSYGLTAFLLEMEDEIAYNAVTMRNENLDKTQRLGAECNMSYRPSDGLRLAANYSYVAAEFDGGVNDGKEIPLVPQHKATVIVEGDLPAGITARTVVSYTGERWLGGDTANTGSKLDAFTVVDLYLSHKSSAIEGLEVFAGVENLFDENYAGVAYQGWMEDGYYPAAGTSFKGGASYRF